MESDTYHCSVFPIIEQCTKYKAWNWFESGYHPCERCKYNIDNINKRKH